MQDANITFDDVYHSLKDKIYRLSMSILKNQDDAENAVQETFIRVYRNLSNFREQSSLSTWVYRICTNECLYILRVRKRDNRLVFFDNFDGLEELLNLIEQDETPEMILQKKEHKREYMKILYNLIYSLNNEDYRKIILTSLSIDENKPAAESLGINYFTYKARLHRAKRAMKETLIQDGR